MNESDFIDQLKRHEGYLGYVYLDTEGIPTCGWGHALRVGSLVPKSIAEKFLERDLEIVRQNYRALELQLDSVREFAIKNMLYNLGLPKLLGFKKMLKAVRTGDWDIAAEEMLDSRWAIQVGKRAKELAFMMRFGTCP